MSNNDLLSQGKGPIRSKIDIWNPSGSSSSSSGSSSSGTKSSTSWGTPAPDNTRASEVIKTDYVAPKQNSSSSSSSKTSSSSSSKSNKEVLAEGNGPVNTNKDKSFLPSVDESSFGFGKWGYAADQAAEIADRVNEIRSSSSKTSSAKNKSNSSKSDTSGIWNVPFSSGSSDTSDNKTFGGPLFSGSKTPNYDAVWGAADPKSEYYNPEFVAAQKERQHTGRMIEKDYSFYNDYQLRKSENPSYSPLVAEVESWKGLRGNSPENTEIAKKRQAADIRSYRYINPDLKDNVYAADAAEYIVKGQNADTKLNNNYDIPNTVVDAYMNNFRDIYSDNLDILYGVANQFMTDEERARYYYNLGRFGQKTADNYLVSLAGDELKNRYNNYVDQKSYNIAKEHPAVGTLFTATDSLMSAVPAVAHTIGIASGADVSDNLAVFRKRMMSNSSGVVDGADTAVGKTVARVATQMAAGTPEMLASFIPVVGAAVSGIIGAGTAGQDKWIQLESRGLLNDDNAKRSILTSAVLGGASAAVISGVSKLIPVKSFAAKSVSTVSSQGAKAVGSWAKQNVLPFVKKAVSGFGLAAFYSGAESMSDEFWFGNESLYNTAKNDYVSKGYSEDDATKNAAIDVWVKPTLAAGLVGAVTSAALFAVESVKRGGIYSSPSSEASNKNTDADIYKGRNKTNQTVSSDDSVSVFKSSDLEYELKADVSDSSSSSGLKYKFDSPEDVGSEIYKSGLTSDDVINISKSLDTDSRAYKYASYLETKDDVSSAEIGNLALLNREEAVKIVRKAYENPDIDIRLFGDEIIHAADDVNSVNSVKSDNLTEQNNFDDGNNVLSRPAVSSTSDGVLVDGLSRSEATDTFYLLNNKTNFRYDDRLKVSSIDSLSKMSASVRSGNIGSAETYAREFLSLVKGNTKIKDSNIVKMAEDLSNNYKLDFDNIIPDNIDSSSIPKQYIIDDKPVFIDRDRSAPAYDNTHPVVKRNDEVKYGRDIEAAFRSKELNLTEGKVQALGELVRDVQDDIIKSVKDDIGSAIPEQAMHTVDSYAAKIDEAMGRLDYSGMNNDQIKLLSKSVANEIYESAINVIPKAYADALKAVDDLRLNHAPKNAIDIERERAKRYAEMLDSIGVITGVKEKRSRFMSHTLQSQEFTVDDIARFMSDERHGNYASISREEMYRAVKLEVDKRDPIDVYKELASKERFTDEDVVKTAVVLPKLKELNEFELHDNLVGLLQVHGTTNGKATAAMALTMQLTPEGQFTTFMKRANKLVDDQISKKKNSDSLSETVRLAREYDKKSRELESLKIEYKKVINELANSVSDNSSDIPAHVYEQVNNLLDEINSYSDELSKSKSINDNLVKKNAELSRRLLTVLSDYSELENDSVYRISSLAEQLAEYEFDLKDNKYSELLRIVAKAEANSSVNHDKGYSRSIEDIILDANKIDHVPTKVAVYAYDAFNSLNNMNSVDDVINMIMAQSKELNTSISNGTRKRLEQLKYYDTDVTSQLNMYKDIARQQIYGLIRMYEPASFGRKASTVKAFQNLSGVPTILRNILGNKSFYTVETGLTHNLVALEQRILHTVFKDIAVTDDFVLPFANSLTKEGRKTVKERTLKAKVEQDLKVNIIDRRSKKQNSKYDLSSRTFTSKFGTELERFLGYILTVPDEKQKGIIQADWNRILKKIEQKAASSSSSDDVSIAKDINSYVKKLSKYGFTKAEAIDMMREDMLYMTFQDDSKLSNLSVGLRDGLNKFLGTKDNSFGLGIFVNHYAKSTGNILSRKLEYSPLGTFKAVADAAEIVSNKVKGNNISAEQQRKFLYALNRPVAGTTLAALGMKLLADGIIVCKDAFNEYKEDQWDKAKNVNYFDINVSALKRILNGGDGETQDGDVLVNIDAIEPLSFMLKIGAQYELMTGSTADWGDLSVTDKGLKIGDMLFELSLDEILDTPTAMFFTNIANSYSEGGARAVVPTIAANVVTSYFPITLSQSARLLDDTAANPYSSNDFFTVFKDVVKSKIPGLRNTLPRSVTITGEEIQTNTGNPVVDIISTMLMPGEISIAKRNEFTDEVDKLMRVEQGYNILPNIDYYKNGINTRDSNYNYEKVFIDSKEYENYKKEIGRFGTELLKTFFDSENYSDLPDDIKVSILTDFQNDARWLVNNQYNPKTALSDDEYKAEKQKLLGEVKIKAADEIYKKSALEAAMSGQYLINEIIDTGQYVKWEDFDGDPEAIKEKLISSKEYSQKKIKEGTYTRYERDGTVSTSAEWTPEERIAEYNNLQKEIDDIKNSTGKGAYIDIRGTWNDLLDEEKQAIIKAFSYDNVDINLPKSWNKKPDMSSLAENTDINYDPLAVSTTHSNQNSGKYNTGLSRPLGWEYAEKQFQKLDEMFERAKADKQGDSSVDNNIENASDYDGSLQPKSSYKKYYNNYNRYYNSNYNRNYSRYSSGRSYNNYGGYKSSYGGKSYSRNYSSGSGKSKKSGGNRQYNWGSSSTSVFGNPFGNPFAKGSYLSYGRKHIGR